MLRNRCCFKRSPTVRHIKGGCQIGVHLIQSIRLPLAFNRASRLILMVVVGVIGIITRVISRDLVLYPPEFFRIVATMVGTHHLAGDRVEQNLPGALGSHLGVSSLNKLFIG